MQQSHFHSGFDSPSSLISPSAPPAHTSSTIAFSGNGTHNAEAGPSTQAGPRKRKHVSTRRTSTADNSEDSEMPRSKARDGPRKKKAARACFHCQKAHLTCDDGVYSAHLSASSTASIGCLPTLSVTYSHMRYISTPMSAVHQARHIR